MSQDVAAPTTPEKVYELPFYMVRTYRPNWKFFKPDLSKRYAELLQMEKDHTLSEKFPKHDRPIAPQFVDRSMIEESFWAVTDENGDLATDEVELAIHVLTVAKAHNPKSDLHPYSKPITAQDYERAKSTATVPGPAKYNMKPKNQLKIKK